MNLSRKRYLTIAIRIVAIALVVWFVGGMVVSSFHDLRSSEISVRWGWVVASGIAYLVALLPMAWFWHRTLLSTGTNVTWSETLAAYYLGHLGKYVPGKFMVVALRTGALRGDGRKTSHIAAAVFVETLTMMAVGAVMACALLALTDRIAELSPWLLPIMATLAVVAAAPTLPPVMHRLLMWRSSQKPSIDTTNNIQKAFDIGWSLIGLGWLASVLTWAGLAASLWMVIKALGASPPTDVITLQTLLLAVTLPVVAGFLSLVPGGIGVRDSLMLVMLGPLLPQPLALLTAILARLVWVISECLAYGIIEGLRRYSFVHRSKP